MHFVTFWAEAMRNISVEPVCDHTWCIIGVLLGVSYVGFEIHPSTWQCCPGDNTGANFWPLEVWQVTMTKGILIGD